MSTAPAPAPAMAPTASAPKEVTVVAHSTLFYWWPVWAVGFIMALITYIDGTMLAVVPPGSKRATFPDTAKPEYVEKYQDSVPEVNKIQPKEGKYSVLVLKESDKTLKDQEKNPARDPVIHISRKKSLG